MLTIRQFDNGWLVTVTCEEFGHVEAQSVFVDWAELTAYLKERLAIHD